LKSSTEQLQESSYQLSPVSYQPRKGNKKAQSARESPAINRRFTLINADEKWQRAERNVLREVSSD
jgi:hypothetical protein